MEAGTLANFLAEPCPWRPELSPRTQRGGVEAQSFMPETSDDSCSVAAADGSVSTPKQDVDATPTPDCRRGAVDAWTDSELGRALLQAGTSNAWSTLDAVANKTSKRLGRSLSPKQLDAFLKEVGDQRLNEYGVWRQGFGPGYMPILVVNPAFGRAAKAAVGGVVCSCGPGVSDPAAMVSKHGRAAAEQVQRYFASQDYNAGRHSSQDKSEHKPTCLLWRPPTSSHLHSWRRGFTGSC